MVKNQILVGKEFWVMGSQCRNMEFSSISTPFQAQCEGRESQEEIPMLQTSAQLFLIW